MCPLRLILIFLSATLAGFFVLRNLRSQPQIHGGDDDDAEDVSSAATSPASLQTSDPSKSSASKVRAGLESVFWAFVDMASGRYLWRHMVSSSSSSAKSL